MKLGRRPPRASPYNVNCDTTSAAPFMSRSERFIFSFSSSKMRRLAAFSASAAATAGVSSRPTPKRIIRPCVISPLTASLTVTLARLTRWTTARMPFEIGTVFYEIPPLKGAATGGFGARLSRMRFGLRGLHGFARQHFGKLRNVVGVDGKDLSAFGEVVPPHAVERVVLRVMVLLIVGDFLDAPRGRHAFGVEGNVVATPFAAQARFGEADRLVGGQRVEHAGHGLTQAVIVHQADGQNFAGARVVHEDAGDFAHFLFVSGDVGTGAV